MEQVGGNGYKNPHWNVDSSSLNIPNQYHIPAKAFNIVWGNDDRYWQWIKIKEEESRKIKFEEAAVLLQVNYLAVTGELDLRRYTAGTTYELYYVVKFRADAFGWHSAPVRSRVKVNGEEAVWKNLNLESYRVKPDVWHEVPGGEFTVSSNKGGRLEFGMYEIETTWWKGSMVLAGVQIKPKA
ncbi:hypothetical protein Acr_00g0092610 [Actinidia rufa]|uniref:Uncharacterized protein n=1 Tax=Actinidia rufa TaxID=165716 RepID=A0A7J0DYQ4_9ERIC|nr:hypothetical protein Acr_00g0092610 [Actinidia rufa]